MKTMHWVWKLSLFMVICGKVLFGQDTTLKPLTINSVNVAQDFSYFNIEFDTYTRIDLPKDEEFFTITPPLKDMRVSSTGWGAWKVYGEIKPHQTYVIKIKKGLRTKSHETKEELVCECKTQSMPTFLTFLSSGPFFSMKRVNWTLPLSLINTAKLSYKVEKVYNDNIIPYDYSSWQNERRMGFVTEGEIAVSIPEDTKVNYPLDLTKIFKDRVPGIYKLNLRGSDKAAKTHSYKSQFIILTDLMISASFDEVTRKTGIFVNSLNTSKPVPDVEVKLYSFSNRVIAEGKTDQDGKIFLTFSDEYDPERDSLNIVTASLGDDFTFLKIDGASEHNLSVFNNDGHHLNNGPSAFIYTERGIARPGESITISAFVRQCKDDLMTPVKDTPMFLEICSPDELVYAKAAVKTNAYGYFTHTLNIDGSARTGLYSIECKIGDEICGNGTFRVATYVPDRIKVSVKAPSPVVEHTEKSEFSVTGNYYFGMPVTDAACTIRVNGLLAPLPAHWRNYSVGDAKRFKPGKAYSSKDEKFNSNCTFPYEGFAAQGGMSTSPVVLDISADIMEPGGRSVTGHTSVISLPSRHFLGLRKISSDDNSNQVTFQYEVLSYEKDEQVAPLEQPVKLTLNRLTWDCVVTRKDNGNLSYEWKEFTVPASLPQNVVMDQVRGEFTLPIPEHGSYELVAECGKNISTRLAFSHWWGEGGAHTANPCVLSFTTDKASYRPGDTANVTFSAMAPGSALLAMGEGSLRNLATANLVAGENTIPVHIPTTAFTEAYFIAITVVTQGPKAIERQFGLLTLKLDQKQSRLQVKLEAPEVARPQKSIKIKAAVTASDGAPATGLIHFFAVDEGILSLVDYKTPDIFDYFYGKRYFDVSFHDHYSDIFPDLRIGENGQIGGDALGLRKKLQPIRSQKSAVVVLNALPIPDSGIVETEMLIPEHLGAMRLMAVASAEKAVGSSKFDIIVRDAIDVMPSGPRAVAPGDKIIYTFTIFNCDQPEGPVTFNVDFPDCLQASSPTSFTENIAKGDSKTVTIETFAQERLGSADIKYTLSMGEFTKEGTLPITIRGLNPPISSSQNTLIPPHASQTFAFNPTDWLTGSTSGTVTTSTSPVVGISESLNWLNSYPYGCLEQTTSKAFPFLYLDALIKAGFIKEEDAARHKTKLAHARDLILSMQLSTGAFSMWPEHDNIFMEGTIYATHFLVEASKRGIEVPVAPLTNACNYLKGLADNAGNPRAMRAYCTYILSLAKCKEYETPARNLLKDNLNDYASFLASAALVKGGHASEAMERFQKAIQGKVWLEQDVPLELSSDASRYSMTLALIMDLVPDSPAANDIAFQIRRLMRQDGYAWGSTQANAWATAALATFAAHHYQKGNASATIKYNDQPVQDINLDKNNTWKMSIGDSLTINNTGDTPIFLQTHADGIPRHVPSHSNSIIQLTRTYLDEKGEIVKEIKQGDLLTVKLDFKGVCKIENLVFVDILPGGFEIEDPMLATRAAAIPREAVKNYGKFYPKFTERRDDRYLMFGDLQEAGSASISYKVRAVTRGRYAVPPSYVEAMYAPDLKAFHIDDKIIEIK